MIFAASLGGVSTPSASAFAFAIAIAGESQRGSKNLTSRACDVQVPADADSWVVGRAHHVRFSDGREFTVIGHDHENRSAGGGSAERLKRTTATAKTGAQLHEAALLLTTENPKAAADAGNDVRYLRVYLQKYPRSFVAVEASPSTVRENLKSYAQLRSAVGDKMRKFGERGAVFSVAEAYALGPDFSLRLAEPTLFRDAVFFGAEETELDQTYESTLIPLAREGAKLTTLKFDPGDAPKINAFLNGLTDRYPTYDPDIDDAEILRSARRFRDFARFSPYLSARLAIMRAMKARDRHIVGQLLAQKRSGLMFIGRAHLESITSLLRKSCLGK